MLTITPRKTIGKWELFSLLAAHGAKPVTINGITGTLNSIQREDGSGSSFNVSLNTTFGERIVHVRTVD